MNGNYMFVLEMLALIVLLFCTGYIVLPHIPKRLAYTGFAAIQILGRQQYGTYGHLHTKEYSAFEKYQIWRFIERRKGAFL